MHGHRRGGAEGVLRGDGQPGSYTDVDHADVIALYGHNMAETQTVLWTRILDRLAGPNPPQVICVDPRPTPVAKRATVHLAPKPGTNVALMNDILHEVIAHGWVRHTAKGTRLSRAQALKTFFVFLEMRHKVEIHQMTGRIVECPIDEMSPAPRPTTGPAADSPRCRADRSTVRRLAREVGDLPQVRSPVESDNPGRWW